MRWALALAVLSITLVACNAARQGTRLTIDTDVHAPGGCPGTASATIRIDRAGDTAIFLDAASSTEVAIEWPIGFAAWLIGDETFLYAPDGNETLRSGGTAVKIGGTVGGPGEPFHVCSVGLRTYS